MPAFSMPKLDITYKVIASSSSFDLNLYSRFIPQGNHSKYHGITPSVLFLCLPRHTHVCLPICYLVFLDIIYIIHICMYVCILSIHIVCFNTNCPLLCVLRYNSCLGSHFVPYILVKSFLNSFIGTLAVFLSYFLPHV